MSTRIDTDARAVVAMMLDTPTRLDEAIAEGLQPSDLGDLEPVFSVILEANRHGTPDSIALLKLVGDRFPSRALEIGNLYAASGEVGGESCDLNLRRSARRLVERRKNREMVFALRTAAENIEKAGTREERDAALGCMTAAVDRISRGDSRGPDWSEQVDGALELIDRRTNGDDEGLISWGIDPIDRSFSEIRSGEFIVIGARPSDGKTSLACQIAATCLKENRGFVFFSLESPGPQLLLRMVSTSVPIPSNDPKDLPPADRKLLRETVEGLKKVRGAVLEDSVFNLDVIESRIRLLAKLDPAPSLAVVDYIQLIRPPAGTERRSREQEVATISRRLAEIAHSTGIPVLALAQLNRDVTRSDRAPNLSDLRESGALEQDADRVILIHRPRKDKFGNDQAATLSDGSPRRIWHQLLIQAKNRNGPTVCSWVEFDRFATRFAAIDSDPR